MCAACQLLRALSPLPRLKTFEFECKEKGVWDSVSPILVVPFTFPSGSTGSERWASRVRSSNTGKEPCGPGQCCDRCPCSLFPSPSPYVSVVTDGSIPTTPSYAFPCLESLVLELDPHGFMCLITAFERPAVMRALKRVDLRVNDSVSRPRDSMSRSSMEFPDVLCVSC